MKLITLVLSGCLVFGFSLAFADESMASDKSIRELLRVTQSRNMRDSVWGQMEQVFDTSFESALQGKTVTEDEQKIFDDMKADLFIVLKDEMNWDKMEGQFVEIYQKTFTQNEINDLIQFYTSPAGQAFAKKMPLAMQNSMVVMQQNMRTMQPRIQMVIETMTKRLKELQANKNLKQP